MSQKVSKQCLMIKTKDQRKFFTHTKNYNQLLEFSKIFNAELSIVRVKNTEILELEELAPALCDKNYKTKNDYKVIKVKMEQDKKLRKTILKDAFKIRNYIRDQFLSGKVVSLKKLKRTFNKKNLTSACLCNHIKNIRKTLEREGLRIIKIGGGEYKIT